MSALVLQGIDALIFDCDGTLVDSEEPGLEVLHALALEDGLSLALDEARQRFRGVRMAECVAWIAAQRPDRPAMHGRQSRILETAIAGAQAFACRQPDIEVPELAEAVAMSAGAFAAIERIGEHARTRRPAEGREMGARATGRQFFLELGEGHAGPANHAHHPHRPAGAPDRHDAGQE